MSDADNTRREMKPADSAATAASGQSPEGRRDRLAINWPTAFAMLALAALLGGIVASYRPLVFGAPANDRLSAVETTVNRLAASFDAVDDAFKELRDAIGQAKTRLDAIDARITALEGGAAGKALQPGGIVGRLSALENQAPQTADAIAALNRRVNGVEAAVPADLPQRLGSFALKSGTADLDLRLTKLEAANTASTLRQAAIMLALADLVRAAGDAQPFTLELSALAATAPDDPAVRILTPYSTMSVPTVATLNQRFPDVARAALNAERRAPGPNFLTRMWNSLLELVSVRRVGNLPGATAEARLARAQVALNARDLSTAIAETAPVAGAAATPLAPWLVDARARSNVERAILDMKARIARALAATGTPQQPASAPPARPANGTGP